MPAIDRQATFSGTKDVAAVLALDAATLHAYLRSRLPGFEGPPAIRQFRGGQSNPTYLLETPARRYVLRRKPPGTLLPSAAGMCIPDWAIKQSKPVVLSDTVLPPVFGPVMTSRL